MLQAPEVGPSRSGPTLGGRRLLLALAVVGASIALALGISLPSIKLTKFYVFATEYSLLSAVQALLERKQLFLGGLVLVFAILVPMFKIAYLLVLTLAPPEVLQRQRQHLRALAWLGKWSMHDVLVLALLIFFLRSTGIYDATSLSGVYFFTASVVLTMLAHNWLNAYAVQTMSSTRLEQLPSASSPHAASPIRNLLLALFILSAAVSFALGITLPSIRFTTVYVWSREHSVTSILYALYRKGDLLLLSVIGVFSVLFPFFKLLYLLTLALSPNLPSAFRLRSVAMLEWLGRYSMTDVMILALIVFYMDASGYTEASVLPGVYFFVAAALMTMLGYGWVNTEAAIPVVSASSHST